MKQILRKNLRQIRGYCDKLDLKSAVACIDDALLDLKVELFPLERLDRIYLDIDSSIRRDMQSSMFFHMPNRQSQFYKQTAIFGPVVAARFPTLTEDIEEAGNCLAFGRSTACVFHLMRVMEVGTQALGSLLGVAFTDAKNWQNILDESNKAIKALPKGKETIELSQIAAHLFNVKVAWRNEVMHPKATYTLEESEDLFTHVKTFMKTLAKHVKPIVAGTTTIQ
jgi:hypothetical protein